MPEPGAVLHTGPRTVAKSSGVEFSVGMWRLRGGKHVFFFWAATAPEELEGWTLAPGRTEVTGPPAANYSLVESRAIWAAGRLSLGSLSVAVERLVPGVLVVTIYEFAATSPGGEKRAIQGEWRLELLEKTQLERPGMENYGAGGPDACVFAGEVAVGFDRHPSCIRVQPTPTPSIAPDRTVPTPTPLPPTYGKYDREVFLVCTPWAFIQELFMGDDGRVTAPAPNEVGTRCSFGP